MKSFTFSLLFFTVFVSGISPVVKILPIAFTPSFEGVTLLLEDGTQIINDSLQIETFKCYISQVELYQGTQLVFAEEQSYHLLDLSNATSLKWTIPVQEDLSYSHIQFNIGIDSLTNLSGVLGGDLDPTKGMYWTWQSGYINVKFEGIASQCSARQHRFHFHIGGYTSPFHTLQTVRLELKNTQEINIGMAIDQWLSKIDLTRQCLVMSPGQEAALLARMLPEIFTAK